MIIDSRLTFEQAIEGTTATKEVIDEMALLDVRYYGLDGELHQGQIMVNKNVEKDTREIFDIILETRFPINKCVPLSVYGWSDDASMDDNNSSAFCYRVIAGTNKMSQHSFGYAIDINPRFNPMIYVDGRVLPQNGVYDKSRPGTLLEGSDIVKAFEGRGFLWRGRNRQKYDDLHHFDKLIES
ncbi:MAG: M15 family metallopeptidase [Lactobacillaceae bacterium]|jgi:hypothetical protein|nr:M15 family metallopeptidase [Lactobacillaceae bacterium]